MRGAGAVLVATGTPEYERATDEAHACDLVQAHLIEVLSAIGREMIDIYFFRVREMAEEFQISGALRAMEMAKQEGHIGHMGIRCDGSSLATLGVWQFHDAFDILLVPRNHRDGAAYEMLAPLAAERRVGLVTSQPLDWGEGRSFTDAPEHWRLRNLTQSFYGQTLAQAVIADLAKEHPVLVSVRTPKEVELAVTSTSHPRPEGLTAMLQPFIESFRAVSQQPADVHLTEAG